MNIDWAELKKQKITLLKVIEECDNQSQEDDLTGILHLIDAIQDNALESGMWTEEQIF